MLPMSEIGASACGRGLRARTPRKAPGELQRRLSMLLGACLLVSMPGCSPEPGPGSGSGRSGRQNFACSDGSEAQVEFQNDGLTIDLAVLPDGRSQRLTASGRGLPFVGDGTSVYLSNGGIVLVPSAGPSLSCRPATIDPRQARRPP